MQKKREKSKVKLDDTVTCDDIAKNGGLTDITPYYEDGINIIGPHDRIDNPISVDEPKPSDHGERGHIAGFPMGRNGQQNDNCADHTRCCEFGELRRTVFPDSHG
jgi:hypothetical protein